MKNSTKDITNRTAADNEKRIAEYPIEISALSEDDGGGFQALHSALAQSVVGYGSTPVDALTDLKAVTPLFLDVLADTGQSLPVYEPAKQTSEFSGKFNVRVPKVLHACLVNLADEQGVSLNSLVQLLLTASASSIATGSLIDLTNKEVNKAISSPSTQQTHSRCRALSL